MGTKMAEYFVRIPKSRPITQRYQQSGYHEKPGKTERTFAFTFISEPFNSAIPCPLYLFMKGCVLKWSVVSYGNPITDCRLK